MSRQIQFPTGFYEAVTGWTTLTFEWALIKGTWPQDESVEVFMADIAAYEFVDSAYARQPLTNPVAGIITLATAAELPGNIGFTSDPPEFGIMSDGDIAESVVLINVVTNDADSPLVAAMPCFYEANGTPADFLVSSTGTVNINTFPC